MNDNEGFTLIELLVVITIIGILAVTVTTAYIGVLRKSARSEAYSNLQNLRLLEEQFYAENGRYTANLGVNGKDIVTRDANLDVFWDTINDADIEELKGFRPGNDSNFVYWVVQNVRLPNAPAVPFNPANVIAQNFAAVPPDPPCFVAMARGIDGTRVGQRGGEPEDLFAIDCFNNRNF
jgi:prepilin-type N-terminal cleavage/methylation domain-containing protein